ncbi:MAG: hypothetical protein ACXAEX_22100 [Promethearchaeota archaeon]|jgi:hypothetical protein
MKCIWYWEWRNDPFDDDKYRKVGEKVQKAMKENPDAFPKMSPGIHKGRGDGFRLVEGTYEQMKNLVAIWHPVEYWKLEVYFEGQELGEAVRKWHPEYAR